MKHLTTLFGIIAAGAVVAVVLFSLSLNGVTLQQLTGDVIPGCGTQSPVTCRVAMSTNSHDFVSVVFNPSRPYGTPYYGCKADGGLFVLDPTRSVPILQSGNCTPPPPRVGHISFTPATNYAQRSAEEIAFTSQILNFFPQSTFPNLDRRVVYPGRISWTSDPTNTSQGSTYQAAFVTLDGAGSLYVCDVPSNARCSASNQPTQPPNADLSATITGPAQAARSSTVTYALNLSNAGPSNGLGVTATVTVPSGLTFNADQTATCTGNGSVRCAMQNGTLKCGGGSGLGGFVLGTAPSDRSRSCNLSFVVTGNCGQSVALAGNVTVGSNRTDPNSSNNQGRKQVTITCP